MSLDVALRTSCGCGIPIGVNLNPALCSICYNWYLCFIVQNVMHVPVLPALAVLPALWMYVSTSFGGST